MDLQSVSNSLSSGTLNTAKSIPATTKSSTEVSRITGEYQVLKEESRYRALSVSEEALVHTIEKANKAVEGAQQEFHYKIHKSTGELIVTVVNKDTKEVLHEVPPEKFIDLIEKLKELTVGAVIDEKR